MARIPLIEREADLPPEAQAAWKAITDSRGGVRGPFAVLLHSPELAARTAQLGGYVRYQSSLGAADRELVILAVARAMGCDFEWAHHVIHARKAGVRDEAIAAIGAGRAPAGLTLDEALVVGYVTELLGRRRVAEATFGAMRERFGARGLVELTATAGYYAMLACTLNAFEVEPGPGMERLPA